MHLVVQVFSDFYCDVFFLKPACKNDGLPKNLAAYLQQAWRTWKGGKYADHLLISTILHVFLSYGCL